MFKTGFDLQGFQGDRSESSQRGRSLVLSQHTLLKVGQFNVVSIHLGNDDFGHLGEINPARFLPFWFGYFSLLWVQTLLGFFIILGFCWRF